MRRRSWCASVAALNGLAVSAAVLPQPEAPFRGKIPPNVVDSIPYLPPPIAAPKGAPNIIVILLDDVGFGAAGTFGGPVKTPELDRLAAQGLRYNNFTVSAQCSPTRAALLTGRNDHRAGFGTVSFGGYPGYNNIIPKRTVLFADVFRRNGYSTAAIGKWHNTPSWEVTPVGPFDRWPTGLGFDYFYGIMGALDSQWEPALYRNTIRSNRRPGRLTDTILRPTSPMRRSIGSRPTNPSLLKGRIFSISPPAPPTNRTTCPGSGSRNTAANSIRDGTCFVSRSSNARSAWG